MKVTKTVAAIFTAATFALLPVATATAADVCSTCSGSTMWNQRWSNGKIIIQNEGVNRDLWANQYSTSYMKDVDYFWVPGGCDAISRYGYVYTGDRWYGPLNDITNLDVRVEC
jgi:hypothetical protein